MNIDLGALQIVLRKEQNQLKLWSRILPYQYAQPNRSSAQNCAPERGAYRFTFFELTGREGRDPTKNSVLTILIVFG